MTIRATKVTPAFAAGFAMLLVVPMRVSAAPGDFVYGTLSASIGRRCMDSFSGESG